MMALKDSPQFIRGKKVEFFLDDFFEARGWQIEATSAHEERVLCLGDRRFSRNGSTWLVEYKSGLQTEFTGNVFLETISVDTENKAGWVYTCRADAILYAALGNHKILVFSPPRLRAEIVGLKARFREVKTSNQQNRGYDTHGVIVPLEYAEEYLASQIIRVEGWT